MENLHDRLLRTARFFACGLVGVIGLISAAGAAIENCPEANAARARLALERAVVCKHDNPPSGVMTEVWGNHCTGDVIELIDGAGLVKNYRILFHVDPDRYNPFTGTMIHGDPDYRYDKTDTFGCENICPTHTKSFNHSNKWVADGTMDTVSECEKNCKVKPEEPCTTFANPNMPNNIKGCSWYSNGETCDVDTASPDENCFFGIGGVQICRKKPEDLCIQSGSGKKVCLDPSEPADPCKQNNPSVVCDGGKMPPNPPITHQPPYNPNPPPPDVSVETDKPGGDSYTYNYFAGPPPTPAPPNQPPEPPPPSHLCGTAGNPACAPPSTCGQPGGGPCAPPNVPPNTPPNPSGCGGSGQPQCDHGGSPQCGVPGKPACNDDGAASCGTSTTPACDDDGAGPQCGIPGKPVCGTEPPGCTGTFCNYGGAECNVPGKPLCAGGGTNIGQCGTPGSPPCSQCGGVGQRPCTQCGGAGQPPCEQHQSSGGAGCDSPPACSGDQILCGIQYQAYIARCNAENFVNNGSRGDDLGPDMKPEDGVEPEGEPVDLASTLDGGGWLGGGACPQLPAIMFRGDSFELDSAGSFCGWMQLGGTMMLLFAYLFAARILLGGN